MSPGEPKTLIMLQNELLQKTEALNNAIAKGKPVEELKNLFTECSRLYDAIFQIKTREEKGKHKAI